MPELPEVETTLRGLQPYLEGQTLTAVQIRTPRLRLPTPAAAPLVGARVMALERRAKYILVHLANATSLLIHLGMSGRMNTSTTQPQPGKHDHILLTTARGTVTLNDARRFGLFLHIPTAGLAQHPLLKNLGPEPLGPGFTATYLHNALSKRTTEIKPAIMDGKLVVGVGNIYASEALFRSHIHPQKRSHTLTQSQCQTLVKNIQETLQEAITAGGSTLRDYTHGSGELGYFQHQFRVYGRAKEPCPVCGTPVVKITQAQRSTYFCPSCQNL